MSFGMICPELQNIGNNIYYSFLAKEIYRVTPKQGITVHVGNPFLDVSQLLESAGFKIISAENINQGAIARKKGKEL
jgi:hypothetical protein